jgi:hypothetical protein
MGCSACGRKYSPPARRSPSTPAASETGQNGATPTGGQRRRYKITAPRPSVVATAAKEFPKFIAPVGGGPGYPEKLLVKGRKE